MADLPNIHAALVQQIVAICRDDNTTREVEMQNFIEMINDIHVTAVGALAGAVLITAKMHKARGKDYSENMEVVRNLVESVDAAFSLELRSSIMNFIANHDTPNPFEQSKTT